MGVRLQGVRVILRDITAGDISDLYYHYHESPDREHLKWNGPYQELSWVSLKDFAKDYEGLLLTARTHQPRSRLIIEIDGKVRGTVGRYWVSEVTNWFEIGIVIYDSAYWSGGYGTEAFRMWMNYLFTELNTVRLGIGTWSGNERMMRLAAKCGMKEEARVRKARIVQGEYYDAIKMGILREEWEGLPYARNGVGQV